MLSAISSYFFFILLPGFDTTTWWLSFLGWSHDVAQSPAPITCAATFWKHQRQWQHLGHDGAPAEGLAVRAASSQFASYAKQGVLRSGIYAKKGNCHVTPQAWCRL